MSVEILCPAGEERHMVLSPNPMDVLCRVAGNHRPAAVDTPTRVQGQKAICCLNYEDCRIWQTHRQIEVGQTTKKMRDATRSPERTHSFR